MRIPNDSAGAEFLMPRRSRLEWVLEAVSLIALVSAIAVVAIHWTELSPAVPNHYGLSGRPNGWGDKKHLWKLVGDAAGLWALFTIMPAALRYGRVPSEMKRLARGHLLIVKTVIMLVLAHLVWTSVYISLGRRVPALGPAFALFEVVAITAAVIVPMIRITLVVARYRAHSQKPA